MVSYLFSRAKIEVNILHNTLKLWIVIIYDILQSVIYKYNKNKLINLILYGN